MLEIKHVTKRYNYTKILNDINITLPNTGLISIIGPSGCGKTTLLNIIGSIDTHYQGKITYNNKKPRKKNIGFLFQNFHLIQWLNVNQNIKLPLFYRSRKYPTYNHTLGLEKMGHQEITSLSLGQRQRVAYLRAISFYPEIILCDEPTASLDEENAHKIMDLLKEESARRLVILVSHNQELVNLYSDEIYTMKDGCIINHQIINSNKEVKREIYKKGFRKPGILLSLSSIKRNYSRKILMSIGITVSLSCILLAFSLTASLQDSLIDYIDSYIPTSSISFRLKSHESITLEDINTISNEQYVYASFLFLNDYEILGVGEVTDKYTMNNTIEIADDSDYLNENDLYIGRLPYNDDEIVISRSIAMYYKESNEIDDLLDTKINIWYKYLTKVKGKTVTIVGIANNKDDEIYHLNSASFTHVQELFNDDHPLSYYGILYVEDSETNYQTLTNTYTDYEFKIVGESTKETINEFLDKIEIVLFVFSSLAIISSLFLISEVMFLDVVEKKKDLVIMRCFGASLGDIITFTFNQSFIIYIISCITSFFSFYGLQTLLNQYFIDTTITSTSFIIVDYQLILIIDLSGFLLLIICQIIPAIYACTLNKADVLKKKTN